MKDDRLTILVTSCKAYEDVLEIHEFLFKSHWADCPFRRVLVMDEITNGSRYLDDFDEVIEAGKETGRKNHLRVMKALDKILTPYVIMLQEDMLLNNKVSTLDIIEKLKVLEDIGGGCIKLAPFKMGDHTYGKEFFEEGIIEFSFDTPYRISYIPSIWNKEYLRKVSDNIEGAGEFERQGTELSKVYEEKILGCKKSIYPHFNAITRGKWELPAVQYLSYYGITPDFHKHPLMSQKDILKQAFMGYVHNINPNFILRLQNRLHYGKKY